MINIVTFEKIQLSTLMCFNVFD